MIIDHHEKGTTPQKGKHTKTVIDCSTLFGVSSPNEVTLSPKCCTLMTPVGKRTDFNACLSLRNGATLFFFSPYYGYLHAASPFRVPRTTPLLVSLRVPMVHVYG